MPQHLLRCALLIAGLFLFAGCGPSASERTAEAARAQAEIARVETEKKLASAETEVRLLREREKSAVAELEHVRAELSATKNEAASLQLRLSEAERIRDTTPAKSAVSGEVFIVTQGGQNVKLGLVRVSAYKRAFLDDYIRQQKWAIIPINRGLRAKMEAAEAQKDSRLALALAELQLQHVNALFDELPPSEYSTKTDSEGRYSLDIPDDSDLVIIAVAERQIGERTDRYIWTLPKAEWTKPLFLSNDNMAWKELDDLPEQLGSAVAHVRRLQQQKETTPGK